MRARRRQRLQSRRPARWLAWAALTQRAPESAFAVAAPRATSETPCQVRQVRAAAPAHQCAVRSATQRVCVHIEPQRLEEGRKVRLAEAHAPTAAATVPSGNAPLSAATRAGTHPSPSKPTRRTSTDSGTSSGCDSSAQGSQRHQSSGAVARTARAHRPAGCAAWHAARWKPSTPYTGLAALRSCPPLPVGHVQSTRAGAERAQQRASPS